MAPRILFLFAGREKEKWVKEGLAHYLKPLSAFAQIEIKEVSETPKELQKLTLRIPSDCFTVVLDAGGKEFSSEVFAGLLKRKLNEGTSRFCFVVGGSEGLPEEVKSRANLLWSFSPLTFPHHLFRVMLAEQVYRAFSILGGRKYHK